MLTALWKAVGLDGALLIAGGGAMLLLALAALHVWNSYQDRGAALARLESELERRQADYAAAEAGRQRETQILRIGRDLAVAVAADRAAIAARVAATNDIMAGEALHAPDDCDAALDLLFDRLGRLPEP